MLYGRSLVEPIRSKEKINPKNIAIMTASKADFYSVCSIVSVNFIFSMKIYNTFVNVFEVYSDSKMYVLGPFVGASYSIMILETLIKLNVDRLIFIGWCGGISEKLVVGDILIPDGSLIDDGISDHYFNRIRLIATPSKLLKFKLNEVARQKGLIYKNGLVWTTDAVFRETINKIFYLKLKGVIAVEMEISAIFNVATFYNIKSIAILVVSDLIRGSKWLPSFNNKFFKTGRKVACKLATDLCLACYGI